MITKEQIPADVREWALGCRTCGNDPNTIFYRIIDQEGAEVATMAKALVHDVLFKGEHEVVVYEYTPEAKV